MIWIHSLLNVHIKWYHICHILKFYSFLYVVIRFYLHWPYHCTGRTCVSKPTCKSRKDTEGQRGIISCLKFNPDYSGAYAAGTYAHNITIYAENVQNSVLELEGLEFGVTCLRWSPCGNMLWAGEELLELFWWTYLIVFIVLNRVVIDWMV